MLVEDDQVCLPSSSLADESGIHLSADPTLLVFTSQPARGP